MRGIVESEIRHSLSERFILGVDIGIFEGGNKQFRYRRIFLSDAIRQVRSIAPVFFLLLSEPRRKVTGGETNVKFLQCNYLHKR